MTHLIRPRSASAVPPIPVAFHRLPYIMWFTVPIHPIKLGIGRRALNILKASALTISSDARSDSYKAPPYIFQRLGKATF